MEGKTVIKKKVTKVPSSNGRDKLHVVVWEPQCEIKAVLQISHGMIEHIERYDAFARYIAARGIVVAGNDHLGHGRTAKNNAELGYMHAYDAGKAMVSDLHRVTVCLKKAYPGVPFFLLGHSMGSFLSRRYLAEYGNDCRYPSVNQPNSSLNGVILLGTGYQSPAAIKTAKAVAKIVGCVKGERYRSRLIKLLAFGAYLKGIPKYTIVDGNKRARTENDWISRDCREVDRYRKDPFCTYDFTVKGYKTLFQTLDFIEQPENVEVIPKELPVLFIAGTKDPVGHNGRDIRKLHKLYRESVSHDVTSILVKGARHEVLHEYDYMDIFEEILGWILCRIV